MKRLLAAIGFGALVAGCNKGNSAFEELKKTSVNELQLKTQANTVWGLGKFDRWDLDQNVGQLVFSNADGTVARCPAQVIGSYNSADKSWQWAWANSSVASSLQADSLKVKNYGEKNGFKELTEAEWQGSEDDAWAMAAIASKICGSQGVYRGPASDQLFVFFSFGEVKLSKTKQ